MVFIENSDHYLHYIVTVGELSCLYMLHVRIDANKRCIAAKNKFGKYVFQTGIYLITLMAFFLCFCCISRSPVEQSLFWTSQGITEVAQSQCRRNI